jgi:peptidoglycan-associated lipoprotein
MKRAALVLVVAVLGTGSGCGKAARPPAPAVAPSPPSAVEPATEAGEGVAADEYARLKRMSADELDRLGLLDDIHFDYDKYDIRADDRSILVRNAETLRRLDFLRVTIEGHCDERGTVEYNLALGNRRSQAAFDYLVSLGVPSTRLLANSYGKESPICTEPGEACWARNRRAGFKITAANAED